MPAKYVRPYSKGQKNDFRDAEAIAEVVQRPTMKFVATKTADQLDLQALHRVREPLVSQRTALSIRSVPSVRAGLDNDRQLGAQDTQPLAHRNPSLQLAFECVRTRATASQTA
jgi:transposase